MQITPFLCKLDIYSRSKVENVQYVHAQLVKATVLSTYTKETLITRSSYQVTFRSMLHVLWFSIMQSMTVVWQLLSEIANKSNKGKKLIFTCNSNREMAVISFILRQEEKQRSFNSVFLKIVLGALALQQTWAAATSPSQTAHCSLATANTSPASTHVYGSKHVDKLIRHILRLLQSNSFFCFSYSSKNN